eukprot:TRINITY_DN12070_c0_g1_i11.p2 TRINITY_DN12070_c0_g1~~TRINITY_DN12070_c0_g1_i11.p2  ORF type:complete len:302 (+),score=60.69 TRINITY_DN12070_c0_g1_i11:1935-2840(+)
MQQAVVLDLSRLHQDSLLLDAVRHVRSMESDHPPVVLFLNKQPSVKLLSFMAIVKQTYYTLYACSCSVDDGSKAFEICRQSSAIVIMNDKMAEKDKDAEMITISLALQRTCPGSRVLVELEKKELLRFLSPEPDELYEGAPPGELCNAFASGKGYAITMLDAVIYQAIEPSKEDVLEVVRQLLGLCDNGTVASHIAVRRQTVTKDWPSGSHDNAEFGELSRHILKSEKSMVFGLAKRIKRADGTEHEYSMVNPRSHVKVTHGDALFLLVPSSAVVTAHVETYFDEELDQAAFKAVSIGASM